MLDLVPISDARASDFGSAARLFAGVAEYHEWKFLYCIAIKAGLSDDDARDVVQETVIAVAKALREGRFRARATQPPHHFESARSHDRLGSQRILAVFERPRIISRVADWKLIYAVAIKAGLSDAEAHDVVQETVVSVAKQMRADGYDRSKGTFKNWLFTITRRRIVDHLRRRKPEEAWRKHKGAPDTSTSTDTLGRIVDPASVELQAIWSEEWKKNLVDVAIERVKAQISFKQFQIFDLYVLKDWPLREPGCCTSAPRWFT
jgi:RNA polymerase sigma factor (sigma-70 family)